MLTDMSVFVVPNGRLMPKLEQKIIFYSGTSTHVLNYCENFFMNWSYAYAFHIDMLYLGTSSLAPR